MRLKFIGMLAAVALVAGCESAPDETGSAASTGGTGNAGSAVSALPPAAPLSLAEQLVVEVGDRVFFGYDRFDVPSDQQEVLQRQAAWLNKYNGVTITIEGHADERGTREYNLALGERRANAVKDQLVLFGVNASRIKTVSYGEERPVALGSDESAWAQNRRGVTVVNAPGS